MGRYVFVVHSNPVPGREDEYNEWYSNRHLDDLRAVPGVVSARRFKWAEQQPRDVPHHYRYLALYEVETDDPQSFVDALTNGAMNGSIPRSPALADDVSAVFWELL